MSLVKTEAKERRHKRIRKKVHGTMERPRLAVFKSNNNIYAQIINDDAGHTIIAASTLEKEIAAVSGHKGNVKAARRVGEILAKKALDKGVKKVVFDRGGYPYHGRIKALADGARESGLEF
ncbi:MAG: 50S ribosomal protein L18 [bacterium]